MDGIFLKAIKELIEHGELVEPITDHTSPHSGFGTTTGYTREVRTWQISTRDIRSRILRNPARNARLDQAIGMAFWCFRATSSLADVEFYNSNARRFSDDGLTIRAPWGKRIFSAGEDSPFNRALDILKRDPSSLRAVIPVYDVGDVGLASRDVPCLMGLQLMVRKDGLHITCHLRSLNPYWVWAYDHFFLTMLLEFGACLLHTEPGSISYQVSSLQIDERDLPLAVEAMAQPPRPGIPMPPMPKETNWTVLNETLAAESNLRMLLAAKKDDYREAFRIIEELALPSWWKGLLRALCGSYILRQGQSPFEIESFIPDWARII